MIQEIAGFLTIFDIHIQFQAVFINHCCRRQGNAAPEAFFHWQAFLGPDLDIIAFIDSLNRLTILPQRFQQQVIDHRFDLFHPISADLRDENVVIPIHRQTRQLIRLAKNQPAVGKIIALHSFPESISELNPPLKEFPVNHHFRILSQNPHDDMTGFRVKARAQITPVFRNDIHRGSIFRRSFYSDQIIAVHPHLPFIQPAFTGLRNHHFCIITIHISTSSSSFLPV